MGGGGAEDPSRSYAVSAPADRDASQLYYSYRSIKGGGDPSRSYAVSAPADRDASQLYYSYRIIKGGGEILVVVTQCLLLPTGTHHGCTTHTVSLRGGWRGGVAGGGRGGEILAVVTQSDLSRSHVSWRRGGGGACGYSE